jgi:hypothetical protein
MSGAGGRDGFIAQVPAALLSWQHLETLCEKIN